MDDDFKFDRKLNPTDLRALSGEIPHDFHEETLDALWLNNRSDEFYLGLMNGILAALAFQEQISEFKLVNLAAYVASVIEKKEII